MGTIYNTGMNGTTVSDKIEKVDITLLLTNKTNRQSADGAFLTPLATSSTATNIPTSSTATNIRSSCPTATTAATLAPTATS